MSGDQPGLFDGVTIEPEVDAPRLTSQVARVFEVMRDGYWRTLDDIARGGIALVPGYPQCLADPPASISARLRDLRKPRWGGHTVERRRVDGSISGLYEYRLIVSEHGLLDGTAREPVGNPRLCPTCGQVRRSVVEPPPSPSTEEVSQ